nr:MAG TPA: Leukemia NUP98 fusion partner 1 [Caudoviricetes sp.]
MKYLKFWRPDSGLIGGLITGLVITFTGLIIWPPIVAFMKWWSSFWGL